MPAWRIAGVVIAIALVVAYAIGSGRWVTTGSDWYLSLEQPAWQPPGAVFGLAWSYNFVAIAVVGVVMAATAAPGRLAVFLGSLAVTIVLAIAWAYLFYVPHSLVASAIALTACAALTPVPIALAYLQRPWLGWVLVPYQAWLVIAASLAWGYVALDR
jgi:benzodiazapine receptor